MPCSLPLIFSGLRSATLQVIATATIAATVSLAQGTSEAQARRVVAGIEQLLRSQPKTWPDNVVAKLAGIGPSSLDLEVLCWYRTTDFNEFRELRQEALFGILRVVEQAGASFASPAPAVRVVVAPPSEAAPAAGAAAPQRAE